IVPAPGGAVVKAWTLYVPRGSTAVLSDPALQNPTFIPDVEGTYRLALTLDGVADDGAVMAVPQMRLAGQRVPAQGETTQASSSQGWSIGPDPAGVNDMIKWLVDNGTQGGYLIARAGEPMAIGQPVAIRSRNVLKSALPGQESIPNVFLANALTFDDCVGICGIVVKKLGTGAIVLGNFVIVQTNGPVMDCVNTVGKTVGEMLWLTDVDGVVGWTEGTIPVLLGTVISPVGVSGSIQLQPPALFSLIGTWAQSILTVTEAAGVTKYKMLTIDGHLLNAMTVGHVRQAAGIAAENAALAANCIYYATGAEVTNGAWAWSAIGVTLYANPAVPGGMVELAGLPAYPPATPYGRLAVAVVTGATNARVLPQQEPTWII
ncbi:MAG: hypothetical protein Q8M65_03615, partial [Rhodoglobus sp.]|nr:hypothetical protein [Rhodoglobus sp.]